MHEPAPEPIDDCWNRIGIRGDRSCERLQAHIHCRHCPVYAATARTLLTRMAPSAQEAAPIDVPAATPERQSSLPVLVFRVHAEWLALPTAALAEVTPLRPVHALPRRGGMVLGVCNVRGRLLPCVSLAVLLDLPPAQDTHRDKPTPRMLVMGGGSGALVVPVDDVDGIQAVSASAIGPLPHTVSGAHYVRGVIPHAGRSVGLLDDARLVQGIEGRLG
jgi:chemotaxis-related protein WspD